MDEHRGKLEFQKKSEIPKTLLDALGACDRDSFPNVHFLLVVGCTLPISSAESRTILLLNEKDQDIGKIGYDRRTLF